jgi:hypothetical protein
MLWIVLPSANSTRATYSANAARAANSPNTTGATNSADSTSTTNSSDATNTTNPAYSADATHSADATGSAAGSATSDVAVSGEVVVVVYVDGVVTTPSASITPASTPEGPHGDANAERDRQTSGIVSRVVDRRIGVVRGRTPNVNGVVRWHVNDLRIGLLNHNDTFLLNDLRLDLYLLVGLQLPGRLRLRAHTLNSIHHIRLLREECVAQLRRPFDVLGQLLDHVRKSGQSLDARIPVLLFHRVRKLFVF